MNDIERLMKKKQFTSKEFNKKLNSTIEKGWNSKVTLDFLYVAESLGMVRYIGISGGNTFVWEVV